jgi:asparagine synthase (glutamine-hydrolysing)
MVSRSGRWTIAFNGEIYSDTEMRVGLAEHNVQFRGASDTEVILESVAAFGIERTLRQLNGMFAIALWDSEERRLWLVRDRIGIKPLYWARFGHLFLFGSELKALRAHPGWAPAINPDVVSAYLRFGYVPSPDAIYQKVHVLRPGCCVSIRPGEAPHIKPYWSPSEVLGSAVRNRLNLSEEEAVDQLNALLEDSVRRRMVADVPLGAFLSGGIDSSTVVALMQNISSRQVHTFSIGFNEAQYNEAPYARQVAGHLGTDHVELAVTDAHARDLIPKLPEIYDEPFADSSQIPTFLVSQLARQHVTVALSGDGGDELFAGYGRYSFARKLQHQFGVVPPRLRRLMSDCVRSFSTEQWDKILTLFPQWIRSQVNGDRIHKAADVFGVADDSHLYRALMSLSMRPDQLVRRGTEPRGLLWDESLEERFPEFVERMQFIDLNMYLPDDILTKVDRASMAVSLEVRVPLLDYRVAEFAFHLMPRMKLRGRSSKWLLRQVLYRYVPRELVERPKMGFGVPIGSWLRGPLREWAESLLDVRRLSRGDLLNEEPIRKMWDDHQSGRRNFAYPLWSILMLEAWRERWGV